MDRIVCKILNFKNDLSTICTLNVDSTCVQDD